MSSTWHPGPSKRHQTRCEVAAPSLVVPTPRALAVFGEPLFEDLLVLAAVHEVANITPKILGEREREQK